MYFKALDAIRISPTQPQAFALALSTEISFAFQKGQKKATLFSSSEFA